MPNRRLGITRFLAFLFYCAFLKCLKPSTGLARQPSPAAASATGSAAEGQGTDGGRGGSGSDDDDGDDPRTGMRQHRLLGLWIRLRLSGWIIRHFDGYGLPFDAELMRNQHITVTRAKRRSPIHQSRLRRAHLADWRSSARTAYGPLRRGPRQAARRSCRAPPLPPPPRTP